MSVTDVDPSLVVPFNSATYWRDLYAEVDDRAAPGGGWRHAWRRWRTGAQARAVTPRRLRSRLARAAPLA